jgi:hypothetical protein
LEELCSEVGPVKRASIIQSGGKSRGFGFVKFALAEDASRAVSQLHGSTFKSRPLKVELALKKGQKPAGLPPVSPSTTSSPTTTSKKRKAPVSDGKGPEEVAPYPAAEPVRRVPKPRKPKVVLLFNLAEGTTEKQLFKRVKKIRMPNSIRIEVCAFASLVDLLEISVLLLCSEAWTRLWWQEVDGQRVAVMSFTDPQWASEVRSKLDKHSLHGRELAARLLESDGAGLGKKRKPPRGREEPPQQQPEERVPAVAAALRTEAKKFARVIVRNLNFHATEKDLKVRPHAHPAPRPAALPRTRVTARLGSARLGPMVCASCARRQRCPLLGLSWRRPCRRSRWVGRPASGASAS